MQHTSLPPPCQHFSAIKTLLSTDSSQWDAAKEAASKQAKHCQAPLGPVVPESTGPAYAQQMVHAQQGGAEHTTTDLLATDVSKLRTCNGADL
jgi:hypothetical protein